MMNPFDFGQAYIAFWTNSAKAALQAQETARSGSAEVIKAMADFWTAATGVSAAQGMTPPGSDNGPMPPATAAPGLQVPDFWAAQGRFARVMQAWMDLRCRGLEHNAIMLEGWMAAGRAFSEELADRTRMNMQAPDAKAMTAMWTDTASRVLLELQRSEPFLQAQAASIRASTELRLAQRDLIDSYGAQHGVATRAEVENVHGIPAGLRYEPPAVAPVETAQITPAKDGETETSEPPGIGAEIGELQDGAGGPAPIPPPDPPPDPPPRSATREARPARPKAARPSGQVPVAATEIGELQEGAGGPAPIPPPSPPRLAARDPRPARPKPTPGKRN